MRSRHYEQSSIPKAKLHSFLASLNLCSFFSRTCIPITKKKKKKKDKEPHKTTSIYIETVRGVWQGSRSTTCRARQADRGTYQTDSDLQLKPEVE